jgi:hypothetical protein
MPTQTPAPPKIQFQPQPSAPVAARDTLKQEPGRKSWLALLGDQRPGALAIGTALYVLGWGVWAVNAWRLGLGMLPAVDAQYLMAGAPPLAILAAAWLGVRYSRRGLEWGVGWLNRPGAPLWRRVVVAAIAVISISAFATVCTVWWNADPPAWKMGIIFALMFISLAAIPLTFGSAEGREHEVLPRLQRWLSANGGITIAAVLAIALYVRVFADIPQEFGGLRPRCAALDVDAEKLSAETLSDLRRDTATARVVRTRRMEIDFATNDFTLVRPFGGGRVYRLDSGAISTMMSCGR